MQSSVRGQFTDVLCRDTYSKHTMPGHMLAFEAGMIHRDLSEGNVMIHDGGMFTGFLLDLDYAFSWMEALKLAGEEDSDSAEAWVALVKKYNKRVAGIIRPAPEGVEIPVLVDAHERPPRSGAGSRASWTQRMKLKERTVCAFPSCH